MGTVFVKTKVDIHKRESRFYVPFMSLGGIKMGNLVNYVHVNTHTEITVLIKSHFSVKGKLYLCIS